MPDPSAHSRAVPVLLASLLLASAGCDATPLGQPLPAPLGELSPAPAGTAAPAPDGEAPDGEAEAAGLWRGIGGEHWRALAGGPDGAPATRAAPDAGADGAPSQAAAPDAGAADAGADGGPEPYYVRTSIRRIPIDLSGGPLYFTATFDGSQRFSMWIDTLRFAREIERKYGKKLHFTYFVNSCYYDTEVRGSKIGKAESWEELLVRRALTQQALNEGHEIGNHGVRHESGLEWSTERWRAEFFELHKVLERSLFKPLEAADGSFVFPRFDPVPGVAARATGARCETDEDCDSEHCLAVTAEQRFCTQECNRKLGCPEGTACGTPNFVKDTDVCVPVPRYPIEHEGQVLFDARGLPNLKHDKLRPYRIVGYRAPFLEVNDGLTDVLIERRYRYDASQMSLPGPPLWLRLRDQSHGIIAFPLMTFPGSRTIPMDFNYRRAGASGERMLEDYRRNLVTAYRHRRRYPYNVGNHFSLWDDGAYWQALQAVFEFAVQGCPHPKDAAVKRCPDVEFPSLLELSDKIIVTVVSQKLAKRSKKSRRRRRRGTPASSPSSEPSTSPASRPSPHVASP